MRYPHVTIGICTKNAEKTINKTLESLLTLDYPKDLLEVIIVDGLSSDKTMATIKDFFARSKLKSTILSDSGLGLGYARKLIVENSTAELIAFVDADQYLHPYYLKWAIKDLTINPKNGAVRGTIGLTLCTSVPARLEAYETFFGQPSISTDLDVWSFGIGGSLLRKSAIVDAGNFDQKITEAGEDTDLAYRMAKKGWKIKHSCLAVYYNKPRTSWKAMYKQRCGYAAAVNELGKKYTPFKSKKHLLIDTIFSCALSIRQVFKLFKFTHDLRCLLLPVKYAFLGFSYFLTFALR